MKVAKAILACTMVLPALAVSQQQAPTQFDVITVKPHKAGEYNSGTRWDKTGMEMTNNSLQDMIANAYDVKRWLVFGLPSWAESSRWDIQAKVVDPEMKPMDKLSMDERRALLRSALKERFGLVAHTPDKVQPVFLMTVLPDGMKFKQSPPPATGEVISGFGRASILTNNGVMEAKYTSMSRIAETLSYFVERTIIDKTNLTGEYDLNLKWTPEDRATATTDNGANGDTAPSIFEALKEQLGLKLTADKAETPTVVVDHIQQPDAN